jgi:flagellar hook-basal body complex protein FliE
MPDNDSLNIQPLGPRAPQLDPSRLRTAGPRPASEATGSFKDVLTETIGEVQRLRNEADATIKQVVSGEIKDVTDAMIAVEKADIAFQTMMAVRNKMVTAYEEIMRMQV